MHDVARLREAAAAKPVVAIIGGAVAGSEAAVQCAERGAICVVFEQGPRPYGKIEDGLPRWHEKLRDKEYARIDKNLSTDGVYFVPSTRIGEDISWESLRDLGFSAIVLANGAWRDRTLPVEGADAFVGRGLVYQNPFVYWFNHYQEASYDGPTFDIQDGTAVVGGGLASIDVVKIINLELYARALRERGVETDVTTLEIKGIPRILEANGIAKEELGIEGCTLYYRRRKEDMPLASLDNPTAEQLTKLQTARVKIMDRVMRKYFVKFEALSRPVATIEDGDRLAGLRFQRTQIVDGRVKDVEGQTYDVRAPAVISSIGSIPKAIAGLPMKGELYDFADWDTGELTGLKGVFGLGNVLTGKGNIKDSRANAVEIVEQVVSAYLGVGDDAANNDASASATPQSVLSPEVLERIGTANPPSRDTMASLGTHIEARWKQTGYDGYDTWMARHRP